MTDEYLKYIAALFDDQEKAAAMLQAHLVGDRIRRDDGTEAELDLFLEAHRTAHERRVKHGTPHMLSILEFDLHGYSGYYGGCCSSGIRPANLDDMERRRTEPEYVYNPGKRKKL